MKIEQLNPREFEQFQKLIYARSGIRIGDGKVSLLSNRVRRRVKACGFDDFKSYYRFLASDQSAEELEYFLDAVTTNETQFFRTEAHFDWLANSLIPDLMAANKNGDRDAAIRFWSAACANGAEAYSIAMCVAENRFRIPDWSIDILGTDVSHQELSKAREGVYSSRAIESLSQPRCRRFLRHRNDGLWQIKSTIRDAVDFAQHNLMQPMRKKPFDCIFLCNVLIYFDRESKRAVLENVIRSLAPGGYLIVGPSEGVYDMLDSLDKCSPLIYQKPEISQRRKLPSGGSN